MYHQIFNLMNQSTPTESNAESNTDLSTPPESNAEFNTDLSTYILFGTLSDTITGIISF